MQKTTVVVLAAAAFGLGMAVMFALPAPRGLDDASERALADLDGRLAELMTALIKLELSVTHTREAQQETRDAIDALAVRVQALEHGAAAPAATENPASGVNTAGGSAPAPGTAVDGDSAPTPSAFRELLERALVVDGPRLSPEEEQRFWDAARTTPLLAGVIGSMEEAVKADPENVEKRMELSRAYVAKLLTLPSGMEQSVWALKAENEWQQVLTRNPEHWEAQYSLGVNWSYWPDYTNKTPDAIKALERAVQLQEAADARPEQADAYLHLSRCYVKQGNAQKAKEVLDRGLARHPGNEKLSQSLDAMAK